MKEIAKLKVKEEKKRLESEVKDLKKDKFISSLLLVYTYIADFTIWWQHNSYIVKTSLMLLLCTSDTIPFFILSLKLSFLGRLTLENC